MRKGTLHLVLLGTLLAAPAEAYDGTANADDIVLGCANRGGTGNRTWLCINGTFTELDTTCDMDAHVTINALGGNDTVTAVNVYDSYYCGGWATWNPVDMGGYSLYVYGGSGDDTIVGGDGSGYYDFYGDSNNDWVQGAGAGSPSDNYGGSGDDIVINDGGSNYHNLYGQSGDDCCEDEDGEWGVFDAGEDTGDWDVCYYHGGDAGELDHCEESHSTDTCQLFFG